MSTATRSSQAGWWRSLDLSPNFALGHYTMGFVHSQSGDPRLALDATGLSCRLSPFDPRQFAMFATCALAHLRLGEPEEAVAWALKAARCPNAHAQILAIAVECLSLVNRRDEARQLAARIRERAAAYTWTIYCVRFTSIAIPRRCFIEARERSASTRNAFAPRRTPPRIADQFGARCAACGEGLCPAFVNGDPQPTAAISSTNVSLR